MFGVSDTMIWLRRYTWVFTSVSLVSTRHPPLWVMRHCLIKNRYLIIKINELWSHAIENKVPLQYCFFLLLFPLFFLFLLLLCFLINYPLSLLFEIFTFRQFEALDLPNSIPPIMFSAFDLGGGRRLKTFLERGALFLVFSVSLALSLFQFVCTKESTSLSLTSPCCSC